MYENPYLQNMVNPYYRQQITNTGIQWVQGREGAKAFQLQPNSNSVLFDSENEGVFYIKTADSAGMCNLRTFNYTEVVNAEAKMNPDEYVKKSELKALIEEMLGGSNEQSISTAKSNAK